MFDLGLPFARLDSPSQYVIAGIKEELAREKLLLAYKYKHVKDRTDIYSQPSISFFTSHRRISYALFDHHLLNLNKYS